jgi:hypothetical protein
MAEPLQSDVQSLLCCHLIYAGAPRAMSLQQADDLFNAYLAEPGRGIVVHHDHFVDEPGAMAVLAISTPEQRAALHDPGPLDGWTISAHPLRFSPDGAGFYVQGDSTLRRFSHVSLEQTAPREGRCHDYRLDALAAGHPGRYDSEVSRRPE